MSLKDISQIGGKVANEGATEQGVLSSANWNLLVSAVQELQNVSLVSVTSSTNPTASVVNVILSFGKGNGGTVSCQLAIPAGNESTAGVFTPSQLANIKSLIEAAKKAGTDATALAQTIGGNLDTLEERVTEDESDIQNALDCTKKVFPVFANSNVVFEMQEDFADRELDEEEYDTIQTVVCEGTTYVAWCRRDEEGHPADINSIAVLMVDGKGYPSVQKSTLPDSVLSIEELTSRVTTIEATQYVYTLDGIYNSEEEVVHKRGLFFDTADGKFYTLVEYRPRPGAALSHQRILTSVYEYALFVFEKKIYKYNGTELIAVGSSLELGETEGTAYDGKKGKELEDRVEELESHPVSSIYNVTVENPLPSGVFYTLYDNEHQNLSALHVSKDKAVNGMILSFAIAENQWKSYQFLSESIAEENWLNPENWKDFGSLAAGTETYVVIDSLCGPRPTNTPYDLSSAIEALVQYEAKTQITYRKRGLVISYATNDNGTVMETKQFQGSMTDFEEIGLWKDFGGGGKLESKDEPEEGGEDAFSTGGAYDLLPTGLHIDTETEGVVKIAMVNAAGDMVGDEEQFTVGTSGGGTGTLVNIAFETSPLYINAGSPAIAKAAIRSVTMSGQQEQLNNIEKVQLIDRDTNNVLETYTENKASSADLESYDFTYDLSEYCKTAGTRRLQFVATDDSGNKGTRNFNLTAVDVTITSVQTLNYTADTALKKNGEQKSIPMYKFANRQTNITVITEIYIGGQWRSLGNATVSDSYSHSITINPKNCCGYSLDNGVYQIRIHGIDENSGVVGNYLYTSIMCIDESSNVPIVATRWYTDGITGSVKLYQSLSIDYALYNPMTMTPIATVLVDGVVVATRMLARSLTGTHTMQVTNKKTDGSESVQLKVACGSSQSPTATYVVNGSVIDAVMKEGAIYSFDFANRSNDDEDHSIVSGDYSIDVVGANYSSNGFGTYNGRNALRIAERVTATLNHKPFESTSVETNGLGIQFCFAAVNCVDDDAKLISCYDEESGAGFYVIGKSVAIYCANSNTKKLEERRFKQGEVITVGIVVEPVQDAYKHSRDGVNYYLMKMYLNGEEVAAVSYNTGSNALLQDNNITFDGTYGDLYLFYILAWNDLFQFEQAFQNYLVKLTDVVAMVKEYEFEGVMSSQQVTEYEETTTKSRPQAQMMYNGGMPYIIECPYQGSDIEILDHTTSTDDKIKVTLYYYDPEHPWRSFVAYGVERKNQGTTSTLRPVKNPRYYLGKAKSIVPLFPTYTNDEALLCYKLFKALCVLIGENNIPVSTITVKIDYSDSGGANDCGVCDMMNATYRSAGSLFMTPAQRAYDGTWSGKYTEDGQEKSISMSGLVMNHSTANHPVAVFRSKSDTGSNPYFHAKGNWKMDKKEETALGFKKTPGYNKGCLNWGDFTPYYGTSGETLTQIKTRFLADDTVDTSKVYALLLYCGRDFKVMRYKNSVWTETTGSMQQVSGKWTVTGDVVNPVEGFELLQYQDMDWFMGVSSVSDLMAPSAKQSKWVQKLVTKGLVTATTFPSWTQYFESLIDNDNMAADYAMGRRVPYNLLQWMLHCDACDYSKRELSTCKTKWKNDTWKVASIRSMYTYGAFCDYLLAIDQEAKNMQPMWFLEEGHCIINGVYDPSGYVSSDLQDQQPMIMYWNKVYDADGVNGKDNDGGCTCDAETDPNRDSDGNFTNPYAGHGSILFKMMYYQPENVIGADGSTLTFKNAIATLRSAQITEDGLTFKPFSPEGATYYFLTKRLNRWPKRVSSYDGERKYIDFTATSDSIYFYALQGLGLTALPDFIDRRWRFRDGFYQTGGFFSGILSGRIACASGATIKIRAAKSGYFGIGNDSAGSITESVYLNAGEEHTFTQFSHETGALLYIYQADRMSMLDISQISLSDTFSFGIMTLVEELYIGSSTRTSRPVGSYASLTSLPLGELPFLKILNIEKTAITNVDCSKCPRIDTVKANNSQLQRIDLADGATIKKLELPATYNYLRLRYLPLLTISGITFESKANISTLIVEECEKIDSWALLMLIANTSGTKLKSVRVSTVNVRGDGTELDTLNALNLNGLDTTLTLQSKPAICGIYRCTSYKSETAINDWQNAFGSDLRVANALYSQYTMSDLVTDPKNITNEDNKTGYKYGNDYVPSGYIKSIRRYCVPVVATPNSDGSAVNLQLLKQSDNTKFVNGSDYDATDSLGAGYDTFSRIPHFWYKGINDFKVQEKHILLNYGTDMPDPSWTKKNRGTLAELLYKSTSALSLSSFDVNSVISDSNYLTEASANVYRIDVEGMKMVRYYGMNNATYGAVFVDSSGKAIEKAALAITGTTNSPLDFTDGDYIFRDVPNGAKWFIFTCLNSVDQSLECFAVDSNDIEAVEPGWVEHPVELIGMYGMSVDDLVRARSISGKRTRTGTGTQTTNSEWQYDSDGNPKATPVSSMNYTYQDMLNLCRMRGKGYHSISYDQSKILTLLSLCWCGNRDDQSVYGFGTSSQYTTGDKNRVGRDTKYGVHSGTNKVWNVEGAIACNWEVMDFIGVNITDFKAWKKLYRAQSGPVDAIAHIYDPRTDTERKVKYPTGSGNNIARLRMGKYCDYIASSVSSDTSKYVMSFCAGTWYSGSAGRCVGRALYSADARGGLVCAHANDASSGSVTSYGARLAFSGSILNDSAIDALINQNASEYEED